MHILCSCLWKGGVTPPPHRPENQILPKPGGGGGGPTPLQATSAKSQRQPSLCWTFDARMRFPRRVVFLGTSPSTPFDARVRFSRRMVSLGTSPRTPFDARMRFPRRMVCLGTSPITPLDAGISLEKQLLKKRHSTPNLHTETHPEGHILKILCRN